MPPAEVARRLTERDFVMLRQYAEKWMLPTRRIQLQLARLCQITAADRSATLGSFLFDPPPTAQPVADVVEMVAGDMGMGFYKLGQGRKREKAVVVDMSSQSDGVA